MGKASARFLYFLLFYLVCSPLCFGASVTIYNDSPYPLDTTIFSASGEPLKTAHILPQEKVQWDSLGSSSASQSQTPYTILFQCKKGAHFGTCKNIGPGAWVTASSATGGQGFCKTNKESPKR